MASSKSGKKSSIPIPAVVAAVAILIAFMVWWGIRSFGPDTTPKTAAGTAKEEWMTKVVKEAGGDWSKVPDADKSQLNTDTFGHGESAFTSWSKDHLSK